MSNFLHFQHVGLPLLESIDYPWPVWVTTPEWSFPYQLSVYIPLESDFTSSGKWCWLPLTWDRSMTSEATPEELPLVSPVTLGIIYCIYILSTFHYTTGRFITKVGQLLHNGTTRITKWVTWCDYTTGRFITQVVSYYTTGRLVLLNGLVYYSTGSYYSIGSHIRPLYNKFRGDPSSRKTLLHDGPWRIT